MAATTESLACGWRAEADVMRCVTCHGTLEEQGSALGCRGCGLSYPVVDGVLVVRDQPTDDNKIAADFYNSAMWPKFRMWETMFWLCHGGEKRAREVILKHLPRGEGLRVLDVAIGDGAYTSWLPGDWSVLGVDVSREQLAGCMKRNTERDLKLILGEAEALPFHDAQFDAVLSIGGFNHFNDPEQALKEMARVAKPGAPVVVSDERPDLTERMLGHKIGLPGIDRFILSKLMSLGEDFTDLVERHRHMDIAEIGRSVLVDSHYELIWWKSGYLMVGTAP